MCDGYDEPSKGASQPLDEFLCEYVDGTMDPATRAVFEEVLATNPDLAARVEALRDTRALLCHYGGRCRCQAPDGFQTKLQQRLACEVLRADRLLSAPLTDRLQSAAGVASALAVLLVAAAVAGSLLAYAPPSDDPPSPRVVRADRPPVAPYAQAAPWSFHPAAAAYPSYAHLTPGPSQGLHLTALDDPAPEGIRARRLVGAP